MDRLSVGSEGTLRASRIGLMFLGVAAGACSGGAGGRSGSPAPAAFRIASRVDALTIRPGADARVAVSASFLDGTGSDVTVRADDLPSGVTATTATLTPEAPTADLVFRAAPDAAIVQPVQVWLHAENAQGEIHSLSLGLTVTGVPGTLDRTFGSKGVFTIGGTSITQLRTLAVKSDGNIFLAGSRFNGDGTLVTDGSNGWLLAALDPQGRPRTDFANGGAPAANWVAAVAGLEVGKILVAGTRSPDGIHDVHTTLARIDEHGRLDSSFGENAGWQALALSSDWDRPYAVAPAADGSTWVAGTRSTAGTTAAGELVSEGMIVHVGRNGSLEPFHDGSNLIPIPYESHGAVLRLVVQDDGKLLALVGSGVVYEPAPEIFRYLPDGSLDYAYGSDGAADVYDYDYQPVTMCRDGDGVQVVENEPGQGAFGTDSVIVRRLLPNGTQDPWFPELLRIPDAHACGCHSGAGGYGIWIAAQGSRTEPLLIGVDTHGTVSRLEGFATPVGRPTELAVTVDPQGRVLLGGTTGSPESGDDTATVWRVWP